MNFLPEQFPARSAAFSHLMTAKDVLRALSTDPRYKDLVMRIGFPKQS
jgi:hypothetical protein